MSSRSNIASLRKNLSWFILLDVSFLIAVAFIYYSESSILSSVEWANVKYAWLSSLSPLMTLAYLVLMLWKKKALKRWTQVPDSSLSNSIFKLRPKASFIRYLFLKLSVISLTFCILNPKSGGELLETNAKGIEIVIALDLSNSMLAKDVGTDRISRAKELIYSLIDRSGGDKIGLVTFAGSAYTQMPLTNDYNAARLYTGGSDINSISNQGTNISSALEKSSELFSKDKLVSKTILLITDGEDHEAGLEPVLQRIKDNGIKIYAVSVGSEAGAPIPTDDGYKKDNNGQTIISKTNFSLTQQIAETTNGASFKLTDDAESLSEDIVKELRTQKEISTGKFEMANLKPRFRIPLLFSMLFLILILFIPEQKNEA